MMVTSSSPVSSHPHRWISLISLSIVITFLLGRSPALAQTLATNSQSLHGPRTTEQNVYSSRVVTSTPATTVVSVMKGSTGASVGSTRQTQKPFMTTTTYQQQQPRSLKFTLIAGKHWKFNLKTSSLQTSHMDKELRLHKNVSAGNYIIDDDGWFQYNQLQQQLFAWPSLNTKPATYYFVLLPSGLDYEADGENTINIGDVVANIVVELIRPPVESKSSARLDLDQLIDFRLSLDYLHRHSSYPLLLTQIISAFELLSKATSNNPVTGSEQDLNFTPQSITSTTARLLVTTSAPPTTNSIAAVLQQNRLSRSAGKFTEFLLIDSSATQDGEFFSLTWTTLPSLINNTIVPISECRLSLINETISRLSSRSIVYPVVDDKFVISYALDGPLVNSQAIIPTERGNYALKLSLHNPCKSSRLLDELGVTSVNGFPVTIDDKDNKIPVGTTASRNTIAPRLESSSILINKDGSSLDEVNASRPMKVTIPNSESELDRTPEQLSSPAPILPSIGQVSLERKIPAELLLPENSSTDTPSSTTIQPMIGLETAWPAPESQPTPDPLLQIQTSIRRALGTTALPTTTSEQDQRQLRHQPKLQPQTKTLTNFLDPPTNFITNETMSLVNATTDIAIPSTSLSDDPVTTSIASVTNGTKANPVPIISKSGQESSLNDDLIGILNEITELMVSIAVPLAVVLGIVLIVSILIAICNLCIKRRKSKQFEVGDRFKFRYGSERKGFLKKRSKPVILEADQKSLSMGGTPRHQPLLHGDGKSKRKDGSSRTSTSTDGRDFFAMSTINSGQSS